MKRFVRNSLAAMLFFCCAVLQADFDPGKYTPEAKATADRIKEGVRIELKSFGSHPWAGDYSKSVPNITGSLILAPESGWVSEWNGCVGLYDRNYGSLEFTEGLIRLKCAFQNDRDDVHGVAPEYIPINWGKRRYLIPADDVVGFCNAVNDKSENHSHSRSPYLLRTGDEKKRVEGFPDVPEEYVRYLLKIPIRAEIVEVGEISLQPSPYDVNSNIQMVRVTLNVGTEQGLLKGMVLYVTQPEDAPLNTKVTETGGDKSQAMVALTRKDRPIPAVGWRLSTLPPWRGKD